MLELSIFTKNTFLKIKTVSLSILNQINCENLLSNFCSLDKGNQAEWIQVIISALGIFFIVYTLRAQLQVTKIEQQRFKQDNIPIFKMRSLPAEQIIRMVVNNHVGEYKILINKLPAGISIELMNIHNIEGLLEGSIVNWKYEVNDQLFGKSGEDEMMELTVLYSDLYNNYYRQEIYLFLDGTGASFPPLFIGKKINLKNYDRRKN
ncbi:hypothetical protein [Daejeonella sp.]|uniref:hypothetical protein n=1 Tax=Daejeonella sp. TaxID=2805397 RepID=UPI0037BFADA5